jgi:hypothetical protein
MNANRCTQTGFGCRERQNPWKVSEVNADTNSLVDTRAAHAFKDFFPILIEIFEV